MKIREVLATINRMQADGVIAGYAIGGAVGATFFLEPVATLDVDIFVSLKPEPDQLIMTPQPIFEYLTAHGATIEGEYLVIAGWPVQFLPPTGPLAEEALAMALETEVEGEPTRVFQAEHLAALALETGRAKDKARLLQFLEAKVLDRARFEAILSKFGLNEKWERFERQFAGDLP